MSDGIDSAGDVPPDADLRAGPQEPGLGQGTRAGGDVDRVHGGGVDADAHLPDAGLGHRDIRELEHLRAAEATDDHRLHRA